MFNLPQNNQQLIPMGMQQQPIANMPIQNAQTYYPSVKNLSYGNDTFVNVGAPQKDIAKGFWDGFKTVFSKIGEFCSDNFALILTGVGLFGGCKFCSSSMKTYEENKKNKKLDEKGNLQDKDASLKDKAMNSVGYYVHKVFGSNQVEEVEEDNTLREPEKAQLENVATNSEEVLKTLLLNDYINKGSISKILKFENPIIKICALEVIKAKIEDIKGMHKFKRPETIVNTLQTLSQNDDNDIKKRAKDVAKALKDNDYFNAIQKKNLENISEIKIVEPKEEKEDTQE